MSGGRELRVVEGDPDPAYPGAHIVVVEPRSTGSHPEPWPDPIAPRLAVFSRTAGAKIESLPPAEDARTRWPRFAIFRADDGPVDIVVAIVLDTARAWVVSNRLRLGPSQSTTGQ